MELIKCSKCGQPISCIITETTFYPLSADGVYLLANVCDLPISREDRDITCESCDRIFCWATDEKGYILPDPTCNRSGFFCGKVSCWTTDEKGHILPPPLDD